MVGEAFDFFKACAVFFKISLAYGYGCKDGFLFCVPFACADGEGSVNQTFRAQIVVSVRAESIGYAKSDLFHCGCRIKVLRKLSPTGAENAVLGDDFAGRAVNGFIYAVPGGENIALAGGSSHKRRNLSAFFHIVDLFFKIFVRILVGYGEKLIPLCGIGCVLGYGFRNLRFPTEEFVADPLRSAFKCGSGFAVLNKVALLRKGCAVCAVGIDYGVIAVKEKLRERLVGIVCGIHFPFPELKTEGLIHGSVINALGFEVNYKVAVTVGIVFGMFAKLTEMVDIIARAALKIYGICVERGGGYGDSGVSDLVIRVIINLTYAVCSVNELSVPDIITRAGTLIVGDAEQTFLLGDFGSELRELLPISGECEIFINRYRCWIRYIFITVVPGAENGVAVLRLYLIISGGFLSGFNDKLPFLEVIRWVGVGYFVLAGSGVCRKCRQRQAKGKYCCKKQAEQFFHKLSPPLFFSELFSVFLLSVTQKANA